MRLVLGTLLIGAAVAKVAVPDAEIHFGLSFASPAKVQLIAVEVELLVGLWLLSGYAAREARVVAIGLFTLLFGVSVYQYAIGSPSCGCLGVVRVPPLVTATIDAAAVAALLLASFGPPPVEKLGASNSGAGRLIAYGLVASVLLASAFVPLPGSWLAAATGDTVSVEPTVADAGRSDPFSTNTVSVTVHNHSTDPIELIGGSANCSCIAIDDLPKTVPPGESVVIGVRVRYPGHQGYFHRTFELYTTSTETPVVVVPVEGTVTADAVN